MVDGRERLDRGRIAIGERWAHGYAALTLSGLCALIEIVHRATDATGDGSFFCRVLTWC
jgi:hypothetical protein